MGGYIYIYEPEGSLPQTLSRYDVTAKFLCTFLKMGVAFVQSSGMFPEDKNTLKICVNIGASSLFCSFKIIWSGPAALYGFRINVVNLCVTK